MASRCWHGPVFEWHPSACGIPHPLSPLHHKFDFSMSLAISLDSRGQLCQDLRWYPTHCHRQLPEWAPMPRSHHAWGISYYSRKVLCWVWGTLLFIDDQNYLMKISAVSVVFGNIKLVFPFCSQAIELRIRSLFYFLKLYSLPLFRFLKINRLESVGFTWYNSWELEVMELPTIPKSCMSTLLTSNY